MSEYNELLERAKELTGWRIRRLDFYTDTSDPMRIVRGNVLQLSGHNFLVKGNMREPRFGIDDQPKYWVFSCVDLESGDHKIVKTVFREEFNVHIGILKIRCYRSPDKESRALDLSASDNRFMSGYTIYDKKGNNVRILEYIKGETLFNHVPSIEKKHEAYFQENLGTLLWKVYDSFVAIKQFHDNGICHGDIRNDHIIIESKTNQFRWIDFDLKQDISDFDLWSMGNILNYVVAKGILTFKAVMKNPNISSEIKSSLSPQDASAFYEYRMMNLRKVYPYIPEALNDILMNFSVKPIGYFRNIVHFLKQFRSALEEDFSEYKNF